MKDADLLVALDYLLTHRGDALIKWAWGKSTTYHRLKGIQEKVEKGSGLTDANRKYIQMVFNSKHGVGCKIQEWPSLEKYRKVYKMRQETKKIILSCLKDKKIPVRFKYIDKYGNAVGWISFQGIDQTLPADIKSQIFLMPKNIVPQNLQLNLIYEASYIGITDSGAIKVRPI